MRYPITVKVEGSDAHDAKNLTEGKMLVVLEVREIYEGPAEGVVLLRLAEAH